MRKLQKRTVALTLTAALLSASLMGCNDNAARNTAVVTSETTTESADAAAASDAAAEENAESWLSEKLGTLYQYFVDGKYEEALTLLEGEMQRFVNDPQFNAVLYYAYELAGKTEEAAALLDNGNFDLDDFADNAVKYGDELRSQNVTAVDDAEHNLLDSILEIAAKDPESYTAVCTIAQNITEYDEKDPAAYAALYIAYTSLGDTEAAQQILQEAEDNGINVGSLQTAVTEYNQAQGIAVITVTDKGNTYQTSYNSKGSTVSQTQTVTHSDGSTTTTTTDSEGSTSSVVERDETGKITQSTRYLRTQITSTDAEGRTYATMEYTGYQIILFKDGVPTTVQEYDTDGRMTEEYFITAQGKVTSGTIFCWDGTSVPFSAAMLATYRVEIVDGIPVGFREGTEGADGSISGITYKKFDNSVNKDGLLSEYREYEADGTTLIRTMVFQYSFDNSTAGIIKHTTSTHYQDNEVSTVFDFDYDEDGRMTASTTTTGSSKTVFRKDPVTGEWTSAAFYQIQADGTELLKIEILSYDVNGERCDANFYDVDDEEGGKKYAERRGTLDADGRLISYVYTWYDSAQKTTKTSESEYTVNYSLPTENKSYTEQCTHTVNYKDGNISEKALYEYNASGVKSKETDIFYENGNISHETLCEYDASGVMSKKTDTLFYLENSAEYQNGYWKTVTEMDYEGGQKTREEKILYFLNGNTAEDETTEYDKDMHEKAYTKIKNNQEGVLLYKESFEAVGGLKTKQVQETYTNGVLLQRNTKKWGDGLWNSELVEKFVIVDGESVLERETLIEKENVKKKKETTTTYYAESSEEYKEGYKKKAVQIFYNDQTAEEKTVSETYYQNDTVAVERTDMLTADGYTVDIINRDENGVIVSKEHDDIDASRLPFVKIIETYDAGTLTARETTKWNSSDQITYYLYEDFKTQQGEGFSYTYKEDGTLDYEDIIVCEYSSADVLSTKDSYRYVDDNLAWFVNENYDENGTLTEWVKYDPNGIPLQQKLYVKVDGEATLRCDYLPKYDSAGNQTGERDVVYYQPGYDDEKLEQYAFNVKMYSFEMEIDWNKFEFVNITMLDSDLYYDADSALKDGTLYEYYTDGETSYDGKHYVKPTKSTKTLNIEDGQIVSYVLTEYGEDGSVTNTQTVTGAPEETVAMTFVSNDDYLNSEEITA